MVMRDRPTISVAVTHSSESPQRRAWLMEIMRRIGPGMYVVPDMKRGMWDTCRRAYRMAHEQRATHHLVLADDMIPCPNFPRLCRAAVTARPEAIIVLFSMRKSLLEAKDAGLSWVEVEDGAWGGSILMPTPWVWEWLQWDQQNCDPRYLWDDRRITLWAKRHDKPVFLTAPSLVQHVGAGESLVGNSNRLRVASWLADGSDIDWQTEALQRSPSLNIEREASKILR